MVVFGDMTAILNALALNSYNYGMLRGQISMKLSPEHPIIVSKINHLLFVFIFHIIKDKNMNKYILLDILIFSITLYFYELRHILMRL